MTLFSVSPAWCPCCRPAPDHSFERFLNISTCITIVAFAIDVFRILDKGLCDIRVRPCMRTIVFGEYFVDSENLTCHIDEFSVSRILSKFDPPMFFWALICYKSGMSVALALPLLRKQSTRDQSPDIVALGFEQSIFLTIFLRSRFEDLKVFVLSFFHIAWPFKGDLLPALTVVCT